MAKKDEAADDPKEVKALAEKLDADCKLGKSVDFEKEIDLTDEEAAELEPEHMAKLDEIDEKKQEIAAAKEDHRQAMSAEKKDLRELEQEEHRLRNARKTKQRKIKVRAREVHSLKTQTTLIREVTDDGKFGEILDQRPFGPEERKLLQLDWTEPANGEGLTASVSDISQAKAKAKRGGNKRSKRPQPPSGGAA